ncbi:MAG: adenylate/guanylate cyclase domain-containing protein [Elusimicrobia bacterium]|nr:adenylate/guanylate cyclase domain-containing protein [Elusimicrobiota bacterium]
MTEEKEPTGAWLESGTGGMLPIRGACFLGRAANNTVVLQSDTVSRRHAMVRASHMQAEYWLIDLGSSNGTLLNGRRITSPSRLEDKDEIKIGQFAFTFRHRESLRSPGAETIDAEKTRKDIKSTDCWLLLADIEGSTQMAKVLPAEEVARVMGRWMSECKQAIDDNGGTINKYLGDGLFAYWVSGEGEESRVANALSALKRLQAQEAPRFRIVLHYGQTLIGAAQSLGEESLLGNEVNFCFRMERMASASGSHRLLSAAANEHLKTHLPTRPEGERTLSGFEGQFQFFSF